MILATQNPIEYEGTFPLPEAQLDRFLLRLRLGYPTLPDEIRVLELQQLRHPVLDLEPVTTVEEMRKMQESIKRVFVANAIKRYIVELTRSTRESSDVYLGSSPRGSLGLFRAGQALAAIRGRDFVLPDDIKYLAPYVLSHRMVIQAAARMKNLNADQVVSEILHTIIVPGGSFEESAV
jgi:MoxR-like ATPase